MMLPCSYRFSGMLAFLKVSIENTTGRRYWQALSGAPRETTSNSSQETAKVSCQVDKLCRQGGPDIMRKEACPQRA